MNYMCKEPCMPSAEETLVNKEERDILDSFLLTLKEQYPDWNKRLKSPHTKKYTHWINTIRQDLLDGKYGKEMKRYTEETWLHKRK